jgi:Protein of unknown function (DUF2877)
MTTVAAPLQRVPGFESTAYAVAQGQIVWTGRDAVTDHPRNLHSPWRPPLQRWDATRLQAGAQICRDLFAREDSQRLVPKGLMLWLVGQPLPFPLQLAVARFGAIRTALHRRDLPAFETAATRVLGLGHGLTPSGDDFVGGILFALEHAPLAAWVDALPAVKTRIRLAAAGATNPISAALLEDLMAGASYRALHDLLAALSSQNAMDVEAAVAQLLRVGASSGADMLAGVLLALDTTRTTH